MRIPWCIAAIATLLCMASFVSGQQREQQSGRWAGKLKGVGPGSVLQVESDKGDQLLVSLSQRPQQVSFQALATPSFVRAGMLVQFNASLDKKGEANDPISDLKVITQRMGVQIGLQAGGVSGAGLFNSNDDDPNKKKKKVRSDSASYLVTGTVRSIKDGKMYVAAGATVKAELADHCQVSVDISDISFAREGDSVEIEGWHYVNQANQIYANRLTITADKPLGVDGKKRRPAGKGDDKKADEKSPAKDAP